ncbi:MAG: PTS sugar transporter subunit IIA [Treponemataceae bacterium]
MEENILTIEEVARYLRVSERTVYDWAQKGEIPSGKIGTVWRFKKDEIENWISERLGKNTKTTPAKTPILIKNILSPDRIIFLNYSTKNDALVDLANNLSTAPQIKNPKELTTEIIKREELMSTAIGCGIAIPHVRLPSVTDLVMAVGISKTKIIDFHAIDNEPVCLLFMIAAAFNQHAYYLQTLSYFSVKLKDETLRKNIHNAKTSLDVYDLLIKE